MKQPADEGPQDRKVIRDGRDLTARAAKWDRKASKVREACAAKLVRRASKACKAKRGRGAKQARPANYPRSIR